MSHCVDCDLLKFTRCPSLTEAEARRQFLTVDPPRFAEPKLVAAMGLDLAALDEGGAA